MTKLGEIDMFDYQEDCLKRFGRVEEKSYTGIELCYLYALDKLIKKYNFNINLGYQHSLFATCIYKTPANSWVIVDSGEKRDGYIFGEFADISLAVLSLFYFFHIDYRDLPRFLNEFNNIVNSEISLDEINKFMKKCNLYDAGNDNDLDSKTYVKK